MSAAKNNPEIRATLMEMASNYKAKADVWRDCETHMLLRADAADYDDQSWTIKSEVLFKRLDLCTMRDQELNLRMQRLRVVEELAQLEAQDAPAAE